MSRDSNLVIDDRIENMLEYRDKTSGEVQWFAIKHRSNVRNGYRNRYLVYDKGGDLVKVLNASWEVMVFIAKQEGTYANHEKMLECVGARTVKVTAPWATGDEKRKMAKDYLEMVLGHEVPIRKSRTDPPRVYYKIQRRSVVPLTEPRFSHGD